MTSERTPATYEVFLKDGCGRCAFWKTPQCKVHRWESELNALRALLLACGLDEAIKWSMPCYTWQGKNVVMLAAFKNYVALSFFEGHRLNDPKGILIRPGENSHSIRQLRFTDLPSVHKQKKDIMACLREAISISSNAEKPPASPRQETPRPIEFTEALEKSKRLKAAFDKLTPGRQRGYMLYFSSAKQSATRISRIQKCIPRILDGKGMDD